LSLGLAFGESSSIESYFLSRFVAFVFIPFVVIVVLYIIIFLKLKSQRSPGEQSTNAGQQRQQRERNVLKMSIAIVLGFAACFVPYTIGKSLSYFASNIWSCGLKYFNTVTFLMVQVNCAINPCICFIFSRNYREGLKTLLG